MISKRVIAIVVAASALATPNAGSAADAVATSAQGAAPQASSSREIRWDDLIPAGWDPYKRFRDRKLALGDDSDPEMQDLMSEMRMVWDNAPTVTSLEGASIRIPGYIVPLEESHGQLREFLLVPYFGACIHTPPPPANQIIHVFAKTPVKGLKAMDTVWINGLLRQARKDSYMGVSGYEVNADSVTPYEGHR